jgi:EmrB/QacA subfamily drug resistance transporter
VSAGVDPPLRPEAETFGDEQRKENWDGEQAVRFGDSATAPPPAAPLTRSSTVVVTGRSRWLLFGVVSVALFMASIDGTIVATALSTLDHVLHAPVNWTGWTITAYSLGQVVALPVAGRISDQYGRKRVFVAAIVVFTVMSLLCGLSVSIYMLIPLRALQAIGGAAFLPSATGIVADGFGPDRDRAIGMFTSILPAGALVGPVLGGVFIHYWTWRGIFLINVPIGIVLTVMALRVIPASAAKPTARTDFIGVAQLGVAILGIMYAITALGNGHTSVWSAEFGVPVVVAVGTGVFFVRRAARIPVPLIPLNLVWGQGFLVMNSLNFILGAGAFGIGALIPLYAQERYRISVLQSGTLLSARAVGMIVVGALSAYMLRRTGYRAPIAVGMSVIGLGILMIAVHPLVASPYWWLAVGGLGAGVGVGIAAPATNNASLALAPEHVAAIAGLRGMFRQSGAIIGVSVATALAARSHTPSLALVHVFLALAALMVLTLPLVYFVPEHRGAW